MASNIVGVDIVGVDIGSVSIRAVEVKCSKRTLLPRHSSACGLKPGSVRKRLFSESEISGCRRATRRCRSCRCVTFASLCFFTCKICCRCRSQKPFSTSTLCERSTVRAVA